MIRLEFAQKAVVTNGDKVLLVRKSDEDPNNPGKWDLPGGRMKESENVDEHLVREVLEETGLMVSPGQPIHVWSWNMSWHNEPVQVVAVSRYCELRPLSGSQQRREVDDYLCEQRWFDRAELHSLDIIPSQLPTIDAILGEDR